MKINKSIILALCLQGFIILFTILINVYFAYWYGYIDCAKDYYYDEVKGEIIEKDNGDIVFKKTNGWIHFEK